MTARRNFLKLATGVSIASAASVLAVPFNARAESPGVNWDEQFDLVIVGSGFAALAAAYGAYHEGLRNILILERMEMFGGNSAICGGLMCMPLTPLQKKFGIEDSAELMVRDMVKAGRGFNHPLLCQTLASQACTAYDMLIECGVKFKDKVIRLGGHSVPRAHMPENASGGGIVVPMHKYLRSRGIQFRNRCNVVDVIRNGDCVEGVKVQADYDFYANKGRAAKYIKATKGVVVASGGWGKDKQFVSTSMPVYADLESTAQPGATATMIKAMLTIGALPVMLDMFQLGPWASPDEKGAGPASFFADYAFAEGIAIDPTTGARFMNELADRRTRAEAQMEVLKKGTTANPNYPFTFCGEETTTRAEGFAAAYRDGAVRKSMTVAELAQLHQVDAGLLQQAIEDWNQIVRGEKSDPFNKPLDRKTILKPPFYSLRLSPKLHYCMGGVAITQHAEVIDANTCEPISGLFAAGEVAGGTHGMDRLGGCSSVDGLVFGQIAGRSAARRNV
ncbi:flavocytochrome c [Shewanella sp. GXUN23E]|uniref:flavocytochrome c n=1 Tax=Shewanella sp. GXUN23E TaxID=3422498 RepID=UPI003D7EB741